MGQATNEIIAFVESFSLLPWLSIAREKRREERTASPMRDGRLRCWKPRANRHGSGWSITISRWRGKPRRTPHHWSSPTASPSAPAWRDGRSGAPPSPGTILAKPDRICRRRSPPSSAAAPRSRPPKPAPISQRHRQAGQAKRRRAHLQSDEAHNPSSLRTQGPIRRGPSAMARA